MSGLHVGKLIILSNTPFIYYYSYSDYQKGCKNGFYTIGWNAWCIGNAATNLIERDGIFYKKATILTAQQVNDEAPDFLEGANIRHNSDGSWTIVTDWGESTGFPGEAYWVLYGQKADGTPDANILTKTEKSYKDYIVCDENGNDIGWLSEIDPA